jgi:hypothetical protein
MKRSKWAALAVVTALGTMGAAVAGGPVRLAAQPGVFDPDNLGNVSAKWIPGEGLPDAGRADQALVMTKDTVTSENSAAGADIRGAEGLTVAGDTAFDFGFDIREDSHFNAGAPRFDLWATDGFHFIGSVPTVLGSTVDRKGRTWYRVRYDAQNPSQAFPPVIPGSQVLSLSLICDEGTDTDVPNAGHYVVDNISFDPAESAEIRIGKPGENKVGEN